ncbi:Sugar phosphate permease [Enhydrobacter aerosaccus]|uniref:Sugar phosphate permease n=1 Tax=Enhydrobacter aerosaccus TaxID=225324 RepID=A0A1T4K721_9HYPH|nr:MFS transporter [Enhydrobacter aerosaccus]SJZ38219.1 Sugar phosphate permease [Enhydrobacter aerosaccus]
MAGRYHVVFAVWLLTVVNYMERVVIGFAGPSIMHSLHIEPKTFGIVLSSFALGYFLAQIPGGLIADRWGARRVLIIGPLFWALFTGITGLVSTVGAIVAVRLCFGLAEGLSNAATYKAIGDNFDVKERAKAAAIWVTAFAVAPAFTGPLVGLLLASFPWQSVFIMLAVPAILVAFANRVLLPAASVTPRVSMAKDTASFRELLRLPSLWLIGSAFSLWNIAFWGFLGWMPSYLALERHIDIKATGMLGGIPYVFALVGLVLTGWLGSGPLHRHRPQFLAALYLLACASLYCAYAAGTLAGSLAGLSAAALFIYSALSMYGAIVLDLAPEKARAAYSGIVSAIGQIGSVVAPSVIGYLVTASGTFASGFIFMVSALCIAALCALALVPLSPASKPLGVPAPNSSI